jgi:hypothetical protein
MLEGSRPVSKLPFTLSPSSHNLMPGVAAGYPPAPPDTTTHTCVVACCMCCMLLRNHSSTKALWGAAPAQARPHRHMVSC